MKKMGWGKYQIITAVLAAAAALLYNNWLLGTSLNANLLKANGSISEYSVRNQPHHLVFQSLDIISGLLLIILGWLFWKRLSPSRSGRIITGGSIALGAANIADALWALPCSETLERGCRVPISLSPHNLQLPAHAYSSTVIAICYLVLPLAGLVYAWRRGIKLIAVASFFAVLAALIAFGAALSQYIGQRSLSVHTSGAGQQIQMLIVGVWIAAIFISLAAADRKAGSGRPDQ